MRRHSQRLSDGRNCSPIGHNNTKTFFVPNQEPESAWIFGSSSVTVGTKGLFRPYLKIFATPFLPTRLTAPGSPRMLSCRTSGGKEYIQSIHAHWCCKQELLSAQSPPSPGDDQKSAYTGSSPEICSVSPPAHLMGIVRCCHCFR